MVNHNITWALMGYTTVSAYAVQHLISHPLQCTCFVRGVNTWQNRLKQMICSTFIFNGNLGTNGLKLLATLTYKVLSTQQPTYLHNLISYPHQSSRLLRFSSQSLQYMVPDLWNSRGESTTSKLPKSVFILGTCKRDWPG